MIVLFKTACEKHMSGSQFSLVYRLSKQVCFSLFSSASEHRNLVLDPTPALTPFFSSGPTISPPFCAHQNLIPPVTLWLFYLSLGLFFMASQWHLTLLTAAFETLAFALRWQITYNCHHLYPLDLFCP